MRKHLLPWWVLIVAGCVSDRVNHPRATPPPVVRSQTATTSVTSDQDWRAKKPDPNPSRPVVLPQVQRFTLRNGIPAYVVENRGVPMAVTRLLIKAGTCSEPAGKAGIAKLVSSLIADGDEVAEQFESRGGTVNSGASPDLSYVSLDVLAANWQSSVESLARLVQHPSFEAAALERRRTATLAEIRRLADNGGQLSAQVLQSAVYGKDDPCSSPLAGTQDSVAHLSRSDLLDFYRSHWNAKNTAIVVVGDLDSGGVLRVLEDTFGWWGPPKKSVRPTDKTSSSNKTYEKRVIFVNRPGAAQASFSLGHLGPPIDSDDWPSVVVMSRALGGFYFSRITRNLRIQKGYIYSSNFVGLAPRHERSMVSLRNGVAVDKAGIAIAEILKEVRGMIDDPPQDQELELAKTSVADGLAVRLQGNSQIAAFLDDVAANDLPAEYLRSYYEKLKRIRSEDVANAARKFLPPDELNIVLVGPGNALKKDRELLKLGSLVEMTADEYVERGFR